MIILALETKLTEFWFSKPILDKFETELGRFIDNDQPAEGNTAKEKGISHHVVFICGESTQHFKLHFRFHLLRQGQLFTLFFCLGPGLF